MHDSHPHRRDRFTLRPKTRAKPIDLYRQVDAFISTLNDGLFAVISVLAIVLFIGITSQVVSIFKVAQENAIEQAPQYQAP